jgi:hypothetical protein
LELDITHNQCLGATLLEQQPASLKTTQIMHIAFMLAIVIYVVVILVMKFMVGLPFVGFEKPLSTYFQIILGVISLLSLAGGYYWPKITRPKPGMRGTDAWVAANHIVRTAMFQAVAIYGLVLALVIDALPYSFTLMVVSELALFSIFPTEQRWTKWKGVEDGLSG